MIMFYFSRLDKYIDMKENYEAPQVQVLEMEVEGIIAASSGTEGGRGGYGSGGSW